MANTTDRKENEWPTVEDLEFFDRFVNVSDASDLEPMTSHCYKLPPYRIKFKNLNELPNDVPRLKHVARLFDIIIKNMLKKADGNLASTRYWFNLQHPAYKKDGYWIKHKTHEMENGYTLMDRIGKNAKLSRQLDKEMIITMSIFSTKQIKFYPRHMNRR